MTSDIAIASAHLIEFDKKEYVADGDAASGKAGTPSFRLEANIPLWWGGVTSCGDWERIAAEVRVALENWVHGVANGQPDATLMDYGHDQPRLSVLIRRAISGKRSCHANGDMNCWANFSGIQTKASAP